MEGDRYRVLPPDGGSANIHIFPTGTCVREAYTIIAAQFACNVDQLSMRVRNPPGTSLAFFDVELSDTPLSLVAPPGSALIVQWAHGRQHGKASTDSMHNPDPREEDLESHATAGLVTKSIETNVQCRATEMGLAGLYNLGNTCYLNSAMQCLSQTRALASPFLPNDQLLNIGDAFTVTNSFVRLLRDMWRSKGIDTLAPSDLKSAIAARVEIFRGCGQQDAQEVIQALLEALHDELRRPPAKPSIENSCECGVNADRDWDVAQAVDSSVISDAFQGQLRSTVHCDNCDHTEETFELFWSLQIPIPESGEVSLSDALTAFCTEELLDADWR